jgi:hypothetical protein
MVAMMKQAERFTKPGPPHEELERFIGSWETETSIFIPGQTPKKEKGTARFEWLMPGRWAKQTWSGTLMGMQFEGFMMIGYDNFKQSFVSADVNSGETAMRYAEGDLDPGGKALIMYGTLDEYLTGEHDKMVKYLWRFESKDLMVYEVHDLPIGLENTKVVEVTYRRKK